MLCPLPPTLNPVTIFEPAHLSHGTKPLPRSGFVLRPMLKSPATRGRPRAICTTGKGNGVDAPAAHECRPNEDRDLQCQRGQWTPVQSAGVAGKGRARCRLSPGIEGARREIPDRCDARSRLRRDLAWTEELERRRDSRARRRTGG